MDSDLLMNETGSQPTSTPKNSNVSPTLVLRVGKYGSLPTLLDHREPVFGAISVGTTNGASSNPPQPDEVPAMVTEAANDPAESVTASTSPTGGISSETADENKMMPLTKNQRKRRNKALRLQALKASTSQAEGGDTKDVERRPTESTSARTDLTSVSIVGDGSKRTKTDKRNRSYGSNSSGAPAGKRQCPSRKTYASVTQKNTNLQVVIRNDPPRIKFTPEQRYLLEDKINEAYNQHDLSKKGVVWDLTHWDENRIELSCSKEEDVDLIFDLVKHLNGTQIWEGCRLNIMRRSDLPKLSNIFAFIPGKKVPHSEVFSILESRNSGIDTSSWRVYGESEPNMGGFGLRLGIDSLSMEMIRDLNFKPFYGIRRAEFSVRKSVKGKQ